MLQRWDLGACPENWPNELRDPAQINEITPPRCTFRNQHRFHDGYIFAPINRNGGLSGGLLRCPLASPPFIIIIAFYVLPDRKQAEAGLKKLEQVGKKRYGIKA